MTNEEMEMEEMIAKVSMNSTMSPPEDVIADLRKQFPIGSQIEPNGFEFRRTLLKHGWDWPNWAAYQTRVEQERHRNELETLKKELYKLQLNSPATKGDLETLSGAINNLNTSVKSLISAMSTLGRNYQGKL